MTAFALSAMLMASGFVHAPQRAEVMRYMWGESRYQPCAHSRMGEGLIGVAGVMRRRLHEYAHVAAGHCVPARVQIAFLAHEWPRLYPACARRFNAGDLSAFHRCWGKGHRR